MSVVASWMMVVMFEKLYGGVIVVAVMKVPQ